MYNKNHFLNHQQSNFAVFFGKTHIFYLLCSYIFWITIVCISWMRFFDAKLGDASSLYHLDSFGFSVQLVTYFISILSICLVIGTILSLPAILIRSFFNYLIISERKKYKKVFYLVFIAQYLPYLLLILTNGLFYYANTSSKINNSFLYNKKLTQFQKDYEIIGSKNPNGHYIFLIPAYLLDDNQKLSNTKAILPNAGQLFLESMSKPEIIAQMIQQESNDLMEYYAPGPIQGNLNKGISTNQLSIGVDKKNAPLFLNLFSKNILTTKDVRFTKMTLLSNRAIVYLRPLQLVFKTNILGRLNGNWAWENFDNTSLENLSQNAKNLRKNSASLYNFIFLSDLEQTHTKNFFVEKSDFFTQEEILQSEYSLDLNLTIAIKALIASGVKNIAVLPYQSTAENFKTSKFFTLQSMDGKLKGYRTFLHDLPNDLVCKVQYIPNQNGSAVSDSNLLMNNIKFSKKEGGYLEPEYGFYIQQFFSNALYCYENQGQIYILTKKNKLSDMNIRNPALEQNLDIYSLSSERLPHLLTREEKNQFIDKYKYEIFK